MPFTAVNAFCSARRVPSLVAVAALSKVLLAWPAPFSVILRVCTETSLMQFSSFHAPAVPGPYIGSRLCSATRKTQKLIALTDPHWQIVAFHGLRLLFYW